MGLDEYSTEDYLKLNVNGRWGVNRNQMSGVGGFGITSGPPPLSTRNFKWNFPNYTIKTSRLCQTGLNSSIICFKIQILTCITKSSADRNSVLFFQNGQTSVGHIANSCVGSPIHIVLHQQSTKPHSQYKLLLSVKLHTKMSSVHKLHIHVTCP